MVLLLSHYPELETDLVIFSRCYSNYRSGFLLRRSALLEIGGFPRDSCLEDGLCAALLVGKGYGVVKLEEVSCRSVRPE